MATSKVPKESRRAEEYSSGGWTSCLVSVQDGALDMIDVIGEELQEELSGEGEPKP